MPLLEPYAKLRSERWCMGKNSAENNATSRASMPWAVAMLSPCKAITWAISFLGKCRRESHHEKPWDRSTHCVWYIVGPTLAEGDRGIHVLGQNGVRWLAASCTIAARGYDVRSARTRACHWLHVGSNPAGKAPPRLQATTLSPNYTNEGKPVVAPPPWRRGVRAMRLILTSFHLDRHGTYHNHTEIPTASPRHPHVGRHI
jgi:hypothetical protein